jgi:hypothetical protein
MVQCIVCFDDCEQECSFGCAHKLCTECFQRYIDDEFLTKRKSFLFIGCPGQNCQQKLIEETINKYGSEATKKQFQRVLKTIPPANSTPKTLADFNYYYNDAGELRMIPEGDEQEKFHFVSQYHYDLLGDAIVDYIQQEVLVKQCGLKEVLLPLNNTDARITNNIFMSDDALSNPEKLLLLIQGSGPVRAGMWSRALW